VNTSGALCYHVMRAELLLNAVRNGSRAAVLTACCQGFKKCLFLGVPFESCSSTFRVKPTSA
jgi:hypothetical protein